MSLLSRFRKFKKTHTVFGDVVASPGTSEAAQGGQWIQGAIKNPGALREVAEAAGQITEDGTINVNWLRQMAKEPGVMGQRARLALTLRKMR